MIEGIKKHAKSTLGFFQHSARWFSLDFGDHVIKLNAERASQENDVAIYFVHGTADQACAFHTIAYKIKELGLDNQFSSMNLVSFSGRYRGNSIDYFAKQFLKTIVNNGHKRVVIVGHSRGALVCAHLNEYLAKNAGIEVLHCFSICGPLDGSYLAVPVLGLFSASVKQMSKGSAYLIRLRKKISQESNSPYTFIIAGDDCIVPNKSGYVSEYVNQHPEALYSLPNHGHVSIMTSTTFARALRNMLNKEVNVALGTRLDVS